MTFNIGVLPQDSLIDRLKSRDETAFKELVENFKHKVYNTCLGFVRNEADADDLAQEVFIQVFKAIDSFREESQLGTWIYRVAVTKSLEFLRRQKQKKRRGFLQSIWDRSDKLAALSDNEGYHPGIALEHKEQAQVLFGAIDQLPERQKVAFTLHKVEGLSHKEISNIMKLSLSSVESLMFRARNNLKKSLSNYYYRNM